MSINDLIDAVVRCAECGKPRSARCTCHEPKDPVTLHCCECPAKIVVERQPEFFDFKAIVTLCPECTKDPAKLARWEQMVVGVREYRPHDDKPRRKKKP